MVRLGLEFVVFGLVRVEVNRVRVSRVRVGIQLGLGLVVLG